jgi:anti-sigma B factor antagonist
MSVASAKMSVLAGAAFACVKIVGRADFASSIDFRTLVEELRQKGYSFFVLDLSECDLMDSTFLGVLAGLGLKMNRAGKDGEGSPIELLNANPRIAELLETLGVLHLFKLVEGPLSLPEPTEAREHCSLTPKREEVKQACLEAHRTLMEIDPGNVAKFKDLAQFLAEDLKKLKSDGPET